MKNNLIAILVVTVAILSLWIYSLTVQNESLRKKLHEKENKQYGEAPTEYYL